MQLIAIEKALAGNNRKGFESKLNLTLHGKFKGFDVSNSTENVEKTQCFKCNPPLNKPRGEIRLCADCQAEAEQTANALLNNFARARKVIKLDHFCFCCEKRKTSAMMAKLFPICLKCFDELKAKGATAQGNFLNRATNNFFKTLRRATI